ncbi:hypothetical protein M8J76_012798 [Diaphorina citri]|nr:hypothetical protein M8J76_012798 [Diaphorina citri]
MKFSKTFVLVVLIKCVRCRWNSIEDRMSEERDPIYQKAAKENHISQFDGMDSFHIDKEHDDKIKSVLFADCFDIDMGPLAKQSLRFIFQLAKINWTIDSVATSPKYVGKPMTKRMADFLRGRDQELHGHRVRLITEDDFRKYDWILAIDEITLEYLNKIKPKDSKAVIELWNDYDFHKDGDQALLDINNMHCQQDYLNSYHHNLRMSLIFLGNLRCRKCYPIDFKRSEKHWDEVQM